MIDLLHVCLLANFIAVLVWS